MDKKSVPLGGAPEAAPRWKGGLSTAGPEVLSCWPSSSPAAWPGGCWSSPSPQSCPMLFVTGDGKKSSHFTGSERKPRNFIFDFLGNGSTAN